MPLTLHPVSAIDIPTLVHIYFLSFHAHLSVIALPGDLPSVQAWFHKMFEEEVKDPKAVWLKVIDTEKNLAVAYAKWVKPSPGKEVDQHLPDWPEGADVELCKTFFGGLAAKKSAIMGSRGYWCRFLSDFFQFCFCSFKICLMALVFVHGLFRSPKRWANWMHRS